MVELVPYDRDWPERFSVSAAEIAAVLHGARIEHVGSTSVPGLSSKDTIDIAVGVRDVAEVLSPRIVDQLERLGFDYRPGSFADDPDHAFFHRIIEDHRTDHVHVVPVGSATLEEYLVFRDFLRAVPAAADRYESAKHSLAREHRERRSLYVDLKQDVVEELMLEARAWRRRSRER